jgi:hypothetical protein
MYDMPICINMFYYLRYMIVFLFGPSTLRKDVFSYRSTSIPDDHNQSSNLAFYENDARRSAQNSLLNPPSDGDTKWSWFTGFSLPSACQLDPRMIESRGWPPILGGILPSRGLADDVSDCRSWRSNLSSTHPAVPELVRLQSYLIQ